jgi:hypothetical protein
VIAGLGLIASLATIVKAEHPAQAVALDGIIASVTTYSNMIATLAATYPEGYTSTNLEAK